MTPTNSASTTKAKKGPTAKKNPPAKKSAPARKAPALGAAKGRKAPAKAATAKTARKAAAPAKTARKSAGKDGKAPARKKSPFGARFLAQQQKALEAERATYLGQFESLRDEAEALVLDAEPGDVQFDEESGEGDTINMERERDLTLSAQARDTLEEIDHALAKFGLGTYGICEVSGEPIPVERLEAIPWARERVEYKAGGLGRR